MSNTTQYITKSAAAAQQNEHELHDYTKSVARVGDYLALLSDGVERYLPDNIAGRIQEQLWRIIETNNQIVAQIAIGQVSDLGPLFTELKQGLQSIKPSASVLQPVFDVVEGLGLKSILHIEQACDRIEQYYHNTNKEELALAAAPLPAASTWFLGLVTTRPKIPSFN